jgi:hypothetical protein
MDSNSKIFYFSDLMLLHDKPVEYFYDVELNVYHNNEHVQLQVNYSAGNMGLMTNE